MRESNVGLIVYRMKTIITSRDRGVITCSRRETMRQITSNDKKNILNESVTE